MPSRRRLDDRRSARLHGLLREIDAVERDDLLTLAIVEDFEILFGEIPQGIAMAVEYADRHLDQADFGAFLDALRLRRGLRLSRLCGGRGGQKRQHGQRETDQAEHHDTACPSVTQNARAGASGRAF